MPNFYAIMVLTSRNITTSCLGGHITIFGCRSLSQSFGDTFLDVAVVGELDFNCHLNYNNTYFGSVLSY